MRKKKNLWSGVSILIVAVLVITAFIRGNAQAWLLAAAFVIWAVWATYYFLVPYIKEELHKREAKRIRFFMTFGQSYLDHMRCLEDVGMLSTTPVNFNGQEIVPIQFLKALLPDPASLGPRTKGKTNIGCIFTGKKDGKEKTYYIYNVCDHQECYKEVGSQAISYTTGVPAMCGALMLLTGKWTTKGVHTVEEFDPDPYLDALDKYGLPRSESHAPALVD